jgi:hypothetical protein
MYYSFSALLCLLIFSLLIWIIYKGLLDGSILAKDRLEWRTFERAQQPKSFWSFVCLYLIIALMMGYGFVQCILEIMHGHF